ncbi:pilin [Neobacillus driksii]|uniref:pilin n=1 Tax=Neobacillus driksii TaxID=3035913 RepID=UPI0035B65183
MLNSAKTYVAANCVPEGGELTDDELGSYVDGSKIDTYTVDVTEDGDNKITYSITTEDVEVGNNTLTFTAAEISDINNFKEASGEITHN